MTDLQDHSAGKFTVGGNGEMVDFSFVLREADELMSP
jgi:hypothetical protein